MKSGEFYEVILENNGRIQSCKHNILLMKSQIKALTQQNKDLKKRGTKR